MKNDHFAHKASSYEQNQSSVDNVASIADAVLEAVGFDKGMHVMDFGSGTGLLLERIAPYVSRITAVDVSPAMNGQLRDKLGRVACDVDLAEVDLEKETIAGRFDGIISSMTMHHIRDVPALLGKFRSLLHDGGFIAIADLDREDGSFHEEGTEGVFHTGFDQSEIAEAARQAGFKDVEVTMASVVHRQNGDFPVFLLTAVR